MSSGSLPGSLLDFVLLIFGQIGFVVEEMPAILEEGLPQAALPGIAAALQMDPSLQIMMLAANPNLLHMAAASVAEPGAVQPGAKALSPAYKSKHDE